MIINLTAAAAVVPLTALMFSACLLRPADDQQDQPPPGLHQAKIATMRPMTISDAALPGRSKEGRLRMIVLAIRYPLRIGWPAGAARA